MPLLSFYSGVHNVADAQAGTKMRTVTATVNRSRFSRGGRCTTAPGKMRGMRPWTAEQRPRTSPKPPAGAFIFRSDVFVFFWRPLASLGNRLSASRLLESSQHNQQRQQQTNVVASRVSSTPSSVLRYKPALVSDDSEVIRSFRRVFLNVC